MTNIRKSSQINFHSSKSVHGSVAGPKPDAPIYNWTVYQHLSNFKIFSCGRLQPRASHYSYLKQAYLLHYLALSKSLFVECRYLTLT